MAFQNIENKKMSIVSEDGAVEEVEVVVAFKYKDAGDEYVVYTKNERDESNNITVYVSRLDNSTDTPKLVGIDSDEEWNKIKDVLRELSKAE